jgi:hypothetical protein
MDRYFAGLFDGEGCIRIGKWSKPNSTHVRYSLHATLGVNYLPVIQLMHETYGGSISENRHDLRGPNNRIVFIWTGASRVAAEFLHRVSPYLVIKREQAAVALRLQEHIDSTPYVRSGRKKEPRQGSEVINAYRDGLYHQIKELKKQSFPPLLNGGAIEP